MHTLRIITGEINSGKTSELRRRIEEYRRRGMRVGGFITEAVWREGIKQAYYLRRLGTGERILLAERADSADVQASSGASGGVREARKAPAEAEENAPRTPGFVFHRESFALASEWLREARDADVLCIDELGPVELRGEGHWPVLARILEDRQELVETVVRSELLHEFVRRFEALDWKVEIVYMSSIRG
jgi:nucleoside-triphosphatase THEP1